MADKDDDHGRRNIKAKRRKDGKTEPRKNGYAKRGFSVDEARHHGRRNIKAKRRKDGKTEPRKNGYAKRGFSVDEARHWTSLGRSTLYAAMGDGRLPFTKVGRRTVLLRDDLLRFLKGE